jgi:hypothetical protein
MAIPKIDLNQVPRGPIETMKEYTKDTNNPQLQKTTNQTNQLKNPVEENKGHLVNTKA